MKIFRHKYYTRIPGFCIILLLLPVLLTCCEEKDMTPEEVSGSVTLSITLPWTDGGTRTDDQGHEEQDSDYPSFEDFINPNDMGIFLFLGDKKDAPLVKMWTHLKDKDFQGSSITGNGKQSQYLLSLKLNRKDLTTLDPNLNIGPNFNDEVTFRVVILANQTSSRNKKNKYEDYESYKTYEDFITFASTQITSLGTSFYPQNSQVQFTGIIPMFGTMVSTIAIKDLYDSRPDNVVYLGTLYLLRSLVKVQFKDSCVKDNNGYPMISPYPNGKIPEQSSGTGSLSYGLSYYYRKLYNLPYDAMNYQNGYQVHNINLCVNEQDRLASVGDIKSDETILENILYSTYCPEQKIILSGNGEPSEATTNPFFTFYYKVSSADKEWQEKKVHLEGSDLYDENGQKISGYKGLIRNHIYTIEVINTDTRSGKGGEPKTIFSEQEW